jgi:hypothetical protein
MSSCNSQSYIKQKYDSLFIVYNLIHVNLETVFWKFVNNVNWNIYEQFCFDLSHKTEDTRGLLENLKQIQNYFD